jgi:hypothetical protein
MILDKELYHVDGSEWNVHGYEVDPESVGLWTGLYDSTKFENLLASEQHAFLEKYNPNNLTKRNTINDWKGNKIFGAVGARGGDVISNKYYFGSKGNIWNIEFKYGSFLMRFIEGGNKPPNGFILAYDFNLEVYEIISSQYETKG